MCNEAINPVQVVQDLYAALGRGDVATILNLLDEDIVWVSNGRSEDVPYAGYWHGHQQMVAFLDFVAQTCEVILFGPNEVMAFGNYVLSLGHQQVRVKTTGHTFETDWAHLFTIQNGKITRLNEFYDTAAVAKAFQMQPTKESNENSEGRGVKGK